ncbi:MAG: lysine--tRNA ligase [Sphingomonadales bacterium]|nr:lysine--tRNA ligase [Sphingomonadales bacterium]
MNTTREIALESKAWPMQEAVKLLKRFENNPPEKGYVLFETGYGPSGLPHIGTFCEVARTTNVMRAFREISDIPAKMICFSDDMDGLRKVPDNIPNREAMEPYLGQPLTKVPDPFGTHDSFGAHNNARLMAFLDDYGFEYEFMSSTDCYTSGKFDETLLKILENYEKVINVILPTLGEARRKTYSPFLPLCPKTGEVLQVAITDINAKAGTISFVDNDGETVTTPVTGGHCKLQWKVDWAMRWVALDVDYEMAGKDLSESVKLSSIISRILSKRPPEGFSYELFLDENGEKISKSKGNGLSIEEWLRYGPPESLGLYVFQNPKRAKKLHFDVIPKAVDEYYTHLSKFAEQEPKIQFTNPVFYMHEGTPPNIQLPVTFGLLLNLVGTTNTDDADIIWGFVSNYAEGTTKDNHPEMDRLIGYAINFYKDFVHPTKKYRAPDDREKQALEDLVEILDGLPENTDGSDIQTAIYDIGKKYEFENLRDWFKALYEILLGQPQGPRMGNFIALYGVKESKALIESALKGEML